MKIAVLDDYQRISARCADWSVLPRELEIVTFFEPFADAAQVRKELREFEIIVAMRERTPFGADLLRELPDLRLLVTTGMANAAIDIDAATGLGILVCGTGGGGPATAELTWGLILALARHIPEESAGMRRGGWQNTIGIELGGRTLGLLGLGKLGSHVASVARAFGMPVIAWSENLTSERASRVGCELVSKEELFSRSDILSIHVRLGDRTRGLVGERDLRRMKPSALLINTSRGPIVDTNALVRALQERRIAGAGIDVFDEEPLPADSPLRALDNVVLTPHIGYVTEETYRAFYGQAVEDIAGYLDDRPLRTLNEEALRRPRPRP